MATVWLLNHTNQEQYAIASFENSEDALEYKDLLNLEYPANIFFHTVGGIEPTSFIDVEQALLMVNGEDLYIDVQS